MDEPVVRPTGDAKSRLVGIALDIAKRWYDTPGASLHQAQLRRRLWEDAVPEIEPLGFDAGDLKAEVVRAIAQYLGEKTRRRATSIVDDRPREFDDLEQEFESSGFLEEEAPRQALQEIRKASV